MIKLEELQNMSKDELINIISGYVSDQEIWLNQVKELEKQNDRKSAEIERLTEENYKLKVIVDHKCDPFPKWQEEIIEENAELQKQVEQLLEECVTTKKDYLQECEEHLKTVQVVKELEQQVDACNRDCEEYAIENGELEQQVNWLKEDMHKIKSAENETYMLGFEDGEKKATKEICDEILRKLETDWTDAVKAVKETAKSKGVEVE